MVFGSPEYNNLYVVEAAVERVFKHLHTDAEPPHELASSGAVGAEQAAEQWWAARGLPVTAHHEFGNPYKHLYLLSNFPDVVLLFGESKFLTRAAERCARYGIEPVNVKD